LKNEAKGEVTYDKRVAIGHGLVEALKEMDLNTREQISVLMLSLIVIWNDERLPVSMFDNMVGHVRQTIREKLKEVS
jgi:hypothetical protein